jgi:hypothetical protein
VAYFAREKGPERDAGPLTSSRDSQHKHHSSRSTVTW